MRKTKIVCTIGPAVDDENVMRELMLAGMNVARINFSHGNYQDQEGRINTVKRLREELNLPVALLLDTKGPEIRIGTFRENKINLEKDNYFTLFNEDIEGDENGVSITYKDLYKDVNIGQKILINDGTIEVQVEEIRDRDIYCRIINGGTLTNKKSINVPDLDLNLPSVTDKDVEDLRFGITADFDYIAASFVRKAEDVLTIRGILNDNGGSHIKIISKIENREGINNFDEILEASDGIMVARGDLGVEIPMEEVPILQKQFIKKSYRAGKPVITATQMLESMINEPRPTRAEVSDIANAIFDGSTAIMLSGETAMGKYPVECVRAMDRIANTTENATRYWNRFTKREYEMEKLPYEFRINYSVCDAAMNTNAKAIFAFTRTGDTPRIISSFGPYTPIYAITENIQIYRQLALCWNVSPMLFEHRDAVNELLEGAIQIAKDRGDVASGDIIVIAGGSTIVNVDNYGEINKTIGGVIKI